ncbi:MAG: tRNA-intron lyase [Methanosarcinales archaeon Met12]|nr:MAG: tRNA-intron lyase [Methanosarcinales archaeon Met12]
MNGKLVRDRVILEEAAIAELYSTSYYGRPRDGKLELTLTEAAYLLGRERISISLDKKPLNFKEFVKTASNLMEKFELKYIVYKDLRERGYYVQPSVTDFRLYPRGGHPGKTPAEYFVRVVSEREPLPLTDIMRHLETAKNVRKQIILAIVDEEGDITFYDAKKTDMEGKMREVKTNGIKEEAALLGDRVIIWDPELAHALHHGSFFGTLLHEKMLQLSLVESAYLLKKKVIKIVDGKSGKVLSFKKFAEKATRIEPIFDGKYRTYEGLRDKGQVVKTGFKFGSHFRTYEQIDSIEKLTHSKYLVHAIPGDHIFALQELSRAIRLAQSVRKRMIFAYTTDKKVQYVDIGRTKL